MPRAQTIPEPSPTFTLEQLEALAELDSLSPTVRYVRFDMIADAVWDDGPEAA